MNESPNLHAMNVLRNLQLPQTQNMINSVKALPKSSDRLLAAKAC